MNTILTNEGRYFYFEQPWAHPFTITEIAHALSHLCRFTGHTDRFYSVAQHSVLVSRLVPVGLAYDGLLHDAAEAYLGDVASPLKRMLPDYKVIEHNVEEWLFRWFNVGFPLHPDIKKADIRALVTEKRDQMVGDATYKQECGGLLWPDVVPDAKRIKPWSPRRARIEFLMRYEELTGIPYVTVWEKWTRWM